MKVWFIEFPIESCGWLYGEPTQTVGSKTTKGNCNQPYDPKMATIEHLYSHYNPKRKIGRNRNKVTLACAECNNERQRKEGHALGIEELRKRPSQHKKVDIVAEVS